MLCEMLNASLLDLLYVSAFVIRDSTGAEIGQGNAISHVGKSVKIFVVGGRVGKRKTIGLLENT